MLVCILSANVCFAQLQMKPEGADTMTNSTMAKWYTERYRELLSLSLKQERAVYKILLDNRNRQDSLRSNPKTRTEDLAASTFATDGQLKAVLTDAQYYDYLRTSQLMEWRPQSKSALYAWPNK